MDPAGMLEVDSVIQHLQKEKKVPLGAYTYVCREEQASYICKVSLGEYIFFIKKLKQRFQSATDNNLLNQLNNELKALKKFHTLFEKYPQFHVPIPLYRSSDELMLVTESVKGRPITDLCNNFGSRFKKKSGKAIHVCRSFGQLLRIYHASESYPYEVQDVDNTVSYIRERLLSGIFKDNEEDVISDYLNCLSNEIKSNISQYHKNPIHSDVSPNNIFFNENDVSILDFADHRFDHYYYDLISFKLMLETQLANRLKYRKRAGTELSEAFSAGYGFDYDQISNDKMYQLCLLKILSVFIKTYALRKKAPINFTSPKIMLWSWKNKVINCIDYFTLKNIILRIVRER